MRFSFNVLLLLFFIVYRSALAQEITGTVYDIRNGEPLDGAAIYFNNTSIGTITNAKGQFRIDYPDIIITSLVFSYMGFDSVLLDDFSKKNNLEIFLTESNTTLDEVTLVGKNAWPRELMLKEFRKNYLGESENGLASTILNEEDLILRFNKKKKQLTANSITPLEIINKNLAYLIKVDLVHFEVNYSFVSRNKKKLNVKNVYFEGNNFFQSKEIPPSKLITTKRRETYLGSRLHFVRSMANGVLEKEKFKLYNGNRPILSKKMILVSPIDNLNNVKIVFRIEKINILFKNDIKSYIISKYPEFYIDAFGNHSPPDAIIFGGDIGIQRMGDALPLDYLLERPEQ